MQTFKGFRTFHHASFAVIADHPDPAALVTGVIITVVTSGWS